MNKKARFLLIAAAIGGVMASFSAVSALGLKDTSVYGPFNCDACTVASPMPDAGTRAYINSWINSQKIAKNDSFFGIGAGGQIIICNATTCTTYQRTDSADWLGIKQEKITSSRGNRGGGEGGRSGSGGSGSPNGSGAGSGGGGGSGGSGRVTVGPDIPIKNN